MNNKHHALGESPSTASNRLVKDILWSLILETNKHTCFRCGKEMNRQNFSVEHKEPWLNSETPKLLFFSLDNIAFSHKSCNYGEANRKTPEEKEVTKIARRQRKALYMKNTYTTEKRRQKKLNTGH